MYGGMVGKAFGLIGQTVSANASHFKVLDGLYARHSLSVWSMASNLAEIFDAMGIDHDELVVELVNESDNG